MKAEDFQSVRKPLLQANTLPPWCYTSKEFFQQETEKIFKKGWQFVGRMDEIPEVGSYLCHEGLTGSVIIMRTGAATVKAFANSCRHRGNRLLSDSGQCHRIVCPYHSWVYAVDGELLNTPGMDGVIDFHRGDFPLVEFVVQTWAGFIFISHENNPPALTDFLGNMPQFFSSHRLEEMQCVRRIEFDIASNWKLLAENALEAYHTGSVHRATLGRQQASPINTIGNWIGILVDGEESVATLPGDEKPMPHIAGLNDQAKLGTYFTMIYPSTQFAIAQDCMWWAAYSAKSPSQTHLTIGVCFPRSTVALGDFDEMVKPYFYRWETATLEDNLICESQQQGQIHNRPPGRFAASEHAVHALSNWVLDRVFG